MEEREIKILGFDPGFGDIKESFRDEDGKIINKKYSSIVAKAPDEATDMPLFNGQRYYTGGLALARSADEIIDLTGYDNLAEVAPLFLWQTIKNNQIDPDKIKAIVTGLSLSQLKHGKDFKKRLEKFKINKEKFDFTNKVILTPQGVGAKYAIDHYFPDGPDTYLVVDIGHFTIDIVDVIDGTVRQENVHGYANEGVIRICRSLQQHISKTFNEYISLKEAKELLKSKVFYLEGEDYDLSEIISNFSTEYTELTMRNLLSRFPREFKKYRKIYFVGGGAHYIDASFSKSIEILPKPEFYNSVGNLLKGEQEIS